jgi:hypothetical protein
MAQRILAVLAIVLTALALTPSAAHLYALPNKIDLGRDAYFAAQAVYDGWWRLGLLWMAALIADFAFLVATRRRRAPCRLAAAATALVVAAFAVFFIWTQPANMATANWKTAPENWPALRAQWEYAHAAEAGLLFAALCCVAAAAVAAISGPRD